MRLGAIPLCYRVSRAVLSQHGRLIRGSPEPPLIPLDLRLVQLVAVIRDQNAAVAAALCLMSFSMWSAANNGLLRMRNSSQKWCTFFWGALGTWTHLDPGCFAFL